MSILKTRFKRCAQVMDAWHSAGVLTSAFEPVFSALPRLAGVTSPRQRWLGPGRAGQDTMVPGQVDSRLWHQRSQAGDEIHRIEGHLRGAVPVGGLQGVDHLAGGTE
jgi:hypothetical protein